MPRIAATPTLPITRQVGDVQVRLIEVERTSLQDGRPAIRLSVELTNRGTRPAFYADLYFKLLSLENTRIDPVSQPEEQSRLVQGQLSSGSPVTGYVWFSVPAGIGIQAVLYDGATGQATFRVD